MSHKDDETVLHNRLTRWITQNGGRVHPHLTLHTPSTAPRERVTNEKETTSSDSNDHNNNVVIRDDDVRRSRSHDGIATDDNLNNENYAHRGIFANHGAISKGEELIRLPSRLALDGRRFPSVYSCNENCTHAGNAANISEAADGKRNASPWLRCLASVIYAWNEKQRPQQKQQQQQSLCHTSNNSNHGEEQVRYREYWTNNLYEPYLSTLPISYDSLLNWKAIELQHFLRGTTLRVVALQDADDSTATTMDISSLDDKVENSLKKRYETTVVPYLKYLNNNGFVFSSKNEKVHNVNIKKRKIDDSSPERLAVSQNPAKQFNEPKFDDGDAETSIYDELYPLFRQGCMCISTRAFHMRSPESNNNLVQSFEIANPGDDAGGVKASATAANDSTPSIYQGPYLLPYIDLLNHAPRHSAKHVTTLTRDPKNGSFVMVAERDIGLGEEICHAYDASGNVADDEMMDGGESTKDRAETGRLEASTSLTSAQLLQTFGFVDVKEVVAKLSRLADRQGGSGATPTSSLKQTNFGSDLTPAILTKKDICRICRRVAESPYPSSLQSFMLKSGLVDEGWEYWDMPTRNKADDADKSCDHDESMGNAWEKVLGCLPDEITIPFDNPLSDILVTILCLNFLPDDALGELIESSDDQGLVLGQEVLDDYFLGKLVLHSLLEIVSEKLEAYRVSFDEFQADCKRCPNSAEKYSSLLVLLRKLHSSKKSTSESYWGENVSNDIDLLSTILTLDEITLKQLEVSKSVTQKFSYGLSVSLEERASLLELKRMVTMKLIRLDDFGNDDGN